MNIYESISDVPVDEQGCVISVGNFDGVHLGHQTIIREGLALAKRDRLPFYLMTFDPAPVRILRPEKAPRILTPLRQKMKLLAELGVEHVILIKGDEAFFSQTPEDFVEKVLVGQLGVKHIVEGQTFGFGQRRAGTMMSLQTLAEEYDFETHMVLSKTEKLADDDAVAVSSTVIRDYLSKDRYDLAYKGLGHALWIAGEIVPGRGKGKELGYPTANLALATKEQLTPRDGVFAAWARLGDDFEQAWSSKRHYEAALSIGECKTFEDGFWQIEAFLMDLETSMGNLYGKTILLSVVEKIRAQEQFTNEEDLKHAIDFDCRKIHYILQRDADGSSIAK